ncbi:MAG: MoaD/ThiS family protein [Methanomicrobiales archaeon]|nr:MoaD/ThiS family protein [Methanomicrobiales archaeon]
MKIGIRAFARFREIFGEQSMLALPEGMTVAGALAAMAGPVAGGTAALFDREGNLHRYVVVMLNGKRIGAGAAMSAELHDGDEVVIYPPVAGG